MKSKIIIVILLQLTGCFSLMARPTNPAPAKITQPDGSQLTLQLIGDEFFIIIKPPMGSSRRLATALSAGSRLPFGSRENIAFRKLTVIICK